MGVTLSWTAIPYGSLVEFVSSPSSHRFVVRWPSYVGTYDCAFLGNALTCPNWKLSPANAQQGDVRLVVEGLTAQQCAFLSRLPAHADSDEVKAIAAALVSNAGRVVEWDKVPPSAIGIVVKSTAGELDATGRVVFRDYDGEGWWVGQTGWWRWDTHNPSRGQVRLLAEGITDSSRRGQVVRVKNTMSVFALIRSWSAPAPAVPSAPIEPGSRLAWSAVPPGTLVRLGNGDVVLRWPAPDSCGDDCTRLEACRPIGIPEFPHDNPAVLEPSAACEVIAVNLSTQQCAGISGSGWPTDWWRIACGELVPLSMIPNGTLWEGVLGWGVRLSGGDVICYNNGDVSHFSSSELDELSGVEFFGRVSSESFVDSNLRRVMAATSEEQEKLVCEIARAVMTTDRFREWVGERVAMSACSDIVGPARKNALARVQRAVEYLLHHPAYRSESVAVLRKVGIYLESTDDLIWTGRWGRTKPARGSVQDVLLEYVWSEFGSREHLDALAGFGAGVDGPIRFQDGTETMNDDDDDDDDGDSDSRHDWAVAELAARVSTRLLDGARFAEAASISLCLLSVGYVSLVPGTGVPGDRLWCSQHRPPLRVSTDCDTLVVTAWRDDDQFELLCHGLGAIRYGGHRNCRRLEIKFT